jgi:hypothetical protein
MRTPVTVGVMVDKGHGGSGVVGWVGARPHHISGVLD